MGGERILVLDDEPDILDLIEYNLLREGFEVTLAKDGLEGFREARENRYDLVLLDLMLPGLDGLEVCRRLKGDPRTSGIPVIMVTAKGEESDVVLGLGLGADDYVSKPFSPKELVARVRAVLRRGASRKTDRGEERIVRGDLVIDPTRHEVTVAGERVRLTATEFRLLLFLASHPGRVFTRSRLLDVAGSDGAVVVDRTVDVHIRAIRSKLTDRRDLIETIRGVGYRFADSGSDA